MSQLRTKKQNSCNLCIFSYCYIWMPFCAPSFLFLFHKPKQQATVPQCHLISIKKANPPTISISLGQQTLWGFCLPTLKYLFLLNPCLNNCKTWLNSFVYMSLHPEGWNNTHTILFLLPLDSSPLNQNSCNVIETNPLFFVCISNTPTPSKLKVHFYNFKRRWNFF